MFLLHPILITVCYKCLRLVLIIIQGVLKRLLKTENSGAAIDGLGKGKVALYWNEGLKV